MTLFTDKCLKSYCSNRGGKVNIEIDIDPSNTTPTAPPTTILPYQSTAQSVLHFPFIISTLQLQYLTQFPVLYNFRF